MSQTGNIITLAIMVMIIVIVGSFLGFLTPPSINFDSTGNEIPSEPFDWTVVYIGLIAFPIVIFILSGIRIVRQTHRAVIETFGKYNRFMTAGITWIIPIVQRLYSLNVTETLVDVSRQDIITQDNLNANVDAQVYYKIGDTEVELKNAFYNVNNVKHQIVQLAVTTLRDIIGRKPFREVNSNRKELNELIFKTLTEETSNWGIKIVRVELKEITPPTKVQDTMNAIIMAENIRDEAKDLATANETKAKGEKLARIQNAIGYQKEQELRAQGEATAIKTIADGNKYQIETIAKADADRILKIAEATAKEIQVVNESANKYFIENAKDLKALEVTEESLKNNSKIIISPKGISPTLIVDATDAGTNKLIVPMASDRRSDKSKQRGKQTEKESSS